jgi:hypothetical protein
MINSITGNNFRSKISKKEVRLHDSKPTEIIGSSATGKVCLVCTINVSSYCCPQCFVPYCSHQCYLKHGVECTEAFSRQRVKNVLDMEAKEKDRDDIVVIPENVVYGSFRDENEYDCRAIGQPVDSNESHSDEDPSDDDNRDEKESNDDEDNTTNDMEKLGTIALSIMSAAVVSIG